MDQIQKATMQKKKSETSITSALGAWIKEIVTNYRIGDAAVNRESSALYAQIMKMQYVKTVNAVLGIDVREWKQEEVTDEIYRRISVIITDKMARKLIDGTAWTTDTASKWASRVTQLAIVNNWTEAEADAALRNYLKSQRLTIATSDAQWLVETTRNTAVVQIIDPLGNSIEQVANLIDMGDYNAARRLSRQVMKLAKLPISDTQGEVLNYVNDARERLMTPGVQGEIVSNLRRRAAELGSDEKMWLTMGDGKVRKDHAAASGQRKPIEQPFVVGGYQLQYPGDASLGASLSEIINCRCVTRYGKKKAA